LKAYLDRSTMAHELTGEDLIPPNGHIHRNLLTSKQGKLSQAIFKALLRALAELVTAAVTKETMMIQKKQDGQQHLNNFQRRLNNLESDGNTPRFLEVVIKDRLPGLLTLLQTETKQGKGSSGPLVPLVLAILARIAQTSLQNARNLARTLDQSLSEGVWKSVIRLAPSHNNNNNQQQHQGTQERLVESSSSRREESRTAFLHLTRTLLQTRDNTVFHYVSSPGSKDRKMSPGLLVLALRESLRDSFASSSSSSHAAEAYHHGLALFLETLRIIVCHAANVVSIRRWNELFTYDVMQNLCEISIHAPRLAKPDHFQNVLDGTDRDPPQQEEITPLQRAGRGARSLLWLLLVDPERSPLLKWVQHDNPSNQSQSTRGDSGSSEQTVVRAMCRLLETHPLAGKLSLHRCLLHGIQATPVLLPLLFQKLNVPDPVKHPFAFCARLRFVSHLIRNGPSPQESSTGTTNLQPSNVDLRLFWPGGWKKHVFTKALQGGNSLAVVQTLTLLTCFLQRIQSENAELNKRIDPYTGDLLWKERSKKLTAILPDSQVVLSAVSRFDLEGVDRATPVVRSHLCHYLSALTTILPDFLSEVKFDWMKLLPSNAERFCQFPLTLQAQLLQTVKNLLKLSTVSCCFNT
jgi:hypothetical protein